jgi:hypothetical protein
MVIGGNQMTSDERRAIVERLPVERRFAFVAFCAERCLHEAQHHSAAKAQLEGLPLLREGIDMLWARAERGVQPDPARVEAVREHVSTYEQPHPSGEGVTYRYDVTLVFAARVLIKGMKILRDPSTATAEYVAGALEGPVRMVGSIYADWEASRRAELAVIDAALRILADAANQPFSRQALENIPDWPRGELTARYREGRLRDSLPDEEE